MKTLQEDKNPFITKAERDRIEKIRKAAEAYIEQYAFDKKSARACLVKLGTHDEEGHLTEHYTSKR